MMRIRSLQLLCVFILSIAWIGAETIAPRHCHGNIRHLHIAVGPDPATSMTVSFASDWAFPDRPAPIAGVHVGTSPDNLDRFVPEQEFPLTYTIDAVNTKHSQLYYAPYQHHITIDGLEPDTTYYYLPVIGTRKHYEDDPMSLATKPIRGHVQVENIQAENKIMEEQEELEEGENEGQRRRSLEIDIGDGLAHWDGHGRRLPAAYNPTDNPCIDVYKTRSFKTAPTQESENFYPMVFGIIGDIGQVEHSVETLDHMRNHMKGIQAVVLVGDIAYPGQDGRKWDTFFDFLDDHSNFDEIPLMVAAGNHGT
jgi:Purple acid Phosphatase, N-terminal domain